MLFRSQNSQTELVCSTWAACKTCRVTTTHTTPNTDTWYRNTSKASRLDPVLKCPAAWETAYALWPLLAWGPTTTVSTPDVPVQKSEWGSGWRALNRVTQAELSAQVPTQWKWQSVQQHSLEKNGGREGDDTYQRSSYTEQTEQRTLFHYLTSSHPHLPLTQTHSHTFSLTTHTHSLTQCILP